MKKIVISIFLSIFIAKAQKPLTTDSNNSIYSSMTLLEKQAYALINTYPTGSITFSLVDSQDLYDLMKALIIKQNRALFKTLKSYFKNELTKVTQLHITYKNLLIKDSLGKNNTTKQAYSDFLTAFINLYKFPQPYTLSCNDCTVIPGILTCSCSTESGNRVTSSVDIKNVPAQDIDHVATGKNYIINANGQLQISSFPDHPTFY